MADKYQSAQLLLKLYQLRQERTLREARSWFVRFFPESPEEVLEAVRGKDSPLFRMVTTYWDMAASFVSHGVLDEEMFNDTILEHVAVFAKLEPYIDEVRELFAEPGYLEHLERLVRRVPDCDARMEQLRTRMKVFTRAADGSRVGDRRPQEES